MPQGQPLTVPDDGLTTRQRRNRPLLMVHTGDGKGKSTAAFGLAIRGWNQGWNIGVFQFVKSAKWRIGEQTVLERLGAPARGDRRGRAGRVAQDGRRAGPGRRSRATPRTTPATAAEGWQEIKRRLAAEAHDLYVLDEFVYPIAWGWVDLDDVVTTLRDRPAASTSSSPDAAPRPS